MLRNCSFIWSCYVNHKSYPDKHSHFEYGISLDVHGTFSLSNLGFGKNVIIFGADLSSAMHVDN